MALRCRRGSSRLLQSLFADGPLNTLSGIGSLMMCSESGAYRSFRRLDISACLSAVGDLTGYGRAVRKGQILKNVGPDWVNAVLNGEVDSDDVASWNAQRARQLPSLNSSPLSMRR